jgi:hypothetical protein
MTASEATSLMVWVFFHSSESDESRGGSTPSHFGGRFAVYDGSLKKWVPGSPHALLRSQFKAMHERSVASASLGSSAIYLEADEIDNISSGGVFEEQKLDVYICFGSHCGPAPFGRGSQCHD